MNRMVPVLSCLLLPFLCRAGYGAGEKFTFFVDLENTTVTYDAATGEAGFQARVMGVEDADSDGFPNGTQGFSLALRHDPDVIDAVNLDLPEGLASIEHPADPGEEPEIGPAFVHMGYSDDDNAVCIALVYSFYDPFTLAWEEPTELLIIDYEAVPGALDGDSVATDLEFDSNVEFHGLGISQVVTVNNISSHPTLEGATVTFEPGAAGTRFKRGDVNNNGDVSPLSDALALLRWGFAGGDAPECMDAADVDDNGAVSALLDALRLLGVFFGSSALGIPDPGITACGSDPTSDALGCAAASTVCE